MVRGHARVQARDIVRLRRLVWLNCPVARRIGDGRFPASESAVNFVTPRIKIITFSIASGSLRSPTVCEDSLVLGLSQEYAPESWRWRAFCVARVSVL